MYVNHHSSFAQSRNAEGWAVNAIIICSAAAKANGMHQCIVQARKSPSTTERLSAERSCVLVTIHLRERDINGQSFWTACKNSLPMSSMPIHALTYTGCQIQSDAWLVFFMLGHPEQSDTRYCICRSCPTPDPVLAEHAMITAGVGQGATGLSIKFKSRESHTCPATVVS